MGTRLVNVRPLLYNKLKQTNKGNKEMKSLQVTSVSVYGEHTMTHPLPELATESEMIVATLQGVLNAGSTIKSFEVVSI
jgi:hypothetical protein